MRLRVSVERGRIDAALRRQVGLALARRQDASAPAAGFQLPKTSLFVLAPIARTLLRSAGEAAASPGGTSRVPGPYPLEDEGSQK